MSVKRRERVAEAIREALAEILRRVKDPRVGMAGVTSVELSPDMRHARVRISVIGDDETRRRTMEGLERARGFIRSELGRAIRLRHVPELDFRLDESAAYSVRIAQLLREIRAREGGSAGAGAGGDEPARPQPGSPASPALEAPGSRPGDAGGVAGPAEAADRDPAEGASGEGEEGAR